MMAELVTPCAAANSLCVASDSLHESPTGQSSYLLSDLEFVSPTISLLTHQEFVHSSNTYLTENPNSHTFVDGSGAESLFSFEVENNEIPSAVLNTVDDLLSDFGWVDDVTDSTDFADRFLPFIEDGDLLDPRGVFPIPCSTTTTNSNRTHAISFSSTSSTPPSNSPSEYRNRAVPNNKRSVSWRRKQHEDYSDSSSEHCLNNEDLNRGIPGTRLCLTSEERRMLKAMGVQLPSRLPLTKAEEKALKIVRRKIRNKLSAQVSRIKRQHYVSDLERRVQQQEKENNQLRQYVASLENDKRDLMAHLRKLRSHISRLLSKDDRSTPLPIYVESKQNKRYSKTTTQTAAAGGTSLLIVSFLFLAWTAMVPGTQKLSKTDVGLQLSNPLLNISPGRSRTLLESRSEHYPNIKPLSAGDPKSGQKNQFTNPELDTLEHQTTDIISGDVPDTTDLLRLQRLTIQPNESAPTDSGIRPNIETIPGVIKSLDH